MENNGKSGDHSNGVVVVRPAAEVMSRQHLSYYVGISEVTAGAKNISMNLIIIPPGGSAEPHLHKGYETAIYLLRGRVNTRYGQKLENSVICQGKISFISTPTCRTNPSISVPPNRQWLSSRAMIPTSKNMLSPIEYKIATSR
jgi:uncharacterized RmlC-like cupin family protein